MEVQNNLMVATAAAANLYNKPGVLPFLSLCSRYPGSPWAGLLQQTIKEKQANISFGIQRLVNDNRYKLVILNGARISQFRLGTKSSTNAIGPASIPYL